MKKYTDKDLREKLQTAIDNMLDIIEDQHKEGDEPKDNTGKRVNAANALNGLIKTYKDKFNVAPEIGEGGVRKASGKKGF